MVNFSEIWSFIEKKIKEYSETRFFTPCSKNLANWLKVWNDLNLPMLLLSLISQFFTLVDIFVDLAICSFHYSEQTKSYRTRKRPNKVIYILNCDYLLVLQSMGCSTRNDISSNNMDNRFSFTFELILPICYEIPILFVWPGWKWNKNYLLLLMVHLEIKL